MMEVKNRSLRFSCDVAQTVVITLQRTVFSWETVKHSGVGECIVFRGQLFVVVERWPTYSNRFRALWKLEAGLQTWCHLDYRETRLDNAWTKTSQQMWRGKKRGRWTKAALISLAFTVYSEECCLSFRLKQPRSEGYQYHRGALFLPPVSAFAAARWWLLCWSVGQLGRISVSTHTWAPFALRYSLSFNNKLSRDQTERGPIYAGR